MISFMKRDSLKNNFVFQIAYQVLMLFIPLIVAPYLTRTLGSNNLGAYAYVHSVAYYFVLFAMLGISKYGQRLIAQSSSDPTLLRKAFWSLFVTHAIVSLIAIVLYSLFVIFVVKDYSILYWADFFYVISALFDITWLFYGLENFRSVVYRNTLVKVLECVLIFVLVQSVDDTMTYVLICSISILLGQIAMMPIAVKLIAPIRVSFKDSIKHIKPLFILSIAVFAVSLYTIFDKTLLGLFAQESDVAFYDYADRLVKIPLTFIAVVGTVMLPRACKLVSTHNAHEQNKYYNLSVWFVFFIGSVTFWLLLVTAKELAIGYLGPEFENCGKVMLWLSPVIIVVGLGDIIRNQYLIPNKRDKLYTIGICCSATINIVLSLLLLYILPNQFKIIGVIVGTMSAELFGTIFQFYVCRDLISSVNIIKPLLITLALGFISFLFTLAIKFLFPSGLFYTLIILLLGFSFYCLLFYCYSFKYNPEMYNMIKSFIPIKK